MRFTKMQGIGNDYVYVDCFDQRVDDPAALAVKVSDRHFGIGGDGLILVLPSDIADVRMRMFNADGSEAQMCGNGVRCVAKYAYDHGRAKANPMRVQTNAGIKTISLALGAAGKVAAATVDMGEPILEPKKIPVLLPRQKDLERIVDFPLDKFIPFGAPGSVMEDCDLDMRMTCVSMGNPHLVIYCGHVNAVPLEHFGSFLERQPIFPERINVHFVQVCNANEVTMRTWERGSGVTLACGTGACAVCVAGVLTSRTGRNITAHLPGGDLKLDWHMADNRVYMTGPAVEVFSGETSSQ